MIHRNKLINEIETICITKYIYDSYYNGEDFDSYQRFTALLISVAICSHHGGLIDCIYVEGNDKYTDRMNPEKDIFY